MTETRCKRSVPSLPRAGMSPEPAPTTVTTQITTEARPHRGRSRRDALQAVAIGFLAALGVREGAAKPHRTRSAQHRNRDGHDHGKRGKRGKAGPGGAPGGSGPQGGKGDKGDQGQPGPAGTGSCPADTIFIAAVGCVESTIRNRVAFPQAVSTCAAAGRRLLTITELMALVRSPDRGLSVNLGRSEWSGSMSTIQYVFTAGFDDEGSETPSLFANQFRCMTVPAIAT
jgi:hypothetical protein